MSAAPADIAVFSKDRRPVPVVEVKGMGIYPTAQSAAGLRRSLIEPYQTLIRRRAERKEFSRGLQREMKLLERSALHDGMNAATSQHVAQVLDQGTEVEAEP